MLIGLNPNPPAATSELRAAWFGYECRVERVRVLLGELLDCDCDCDCEDGESEGDGNLNGALAVADPAAWS